MGTAFAKREREWMGGGGGVGVSGSWVRNLSSFSLQSLDSVLCVRYMFGINPRFGAGNGLGGASGEVLRRVRGGGKTWDG